MASWVLKYFIHYVSDSHSSDSIPRPKNEKAVCKVEMTLFNGQKQPCNFVLAYHGVSNLARHMKNHHQYIYLHVERNPLSGKNAKVLEDQTVSLAARSVNPGEECEIVPMSFDTGLCLKQKQDHQRRCVLWCALNLRPENMLRDEGLALVLGGISP